MAHFAQLSPTNTVQLVLVVDNADCINPATGEEEEAFGIQFLERIFGGRWKQTSYNASFRKNYAGPGQLYDLERDAFIPPKHFDSWILNEDTCQWAPPIPYREGSDDSTYYYWDENILNWKEYSGPEA